MSEILSQAPLEPELNTSDEHGEGYAEEEVRVKVVEVTPEEAKEGYTKLYVMDNAKDPNSPKLVFTPPEWDAFVSGVKDGEFDEP